MAGATGDEPQVFMMPVHRDRWLDDFKRTVDQPFAFGPEDGRPEALRGLDTTRIWGTRTGERNESMWERMRPGDLVLFYCNDWFFSAARVDETLRSGPAGAYIWNNEESEFIYTLRDYQRIAIRKLDVWEWFEYDENFTRRGLSRVAPDRVESFWADVGDIWDHVREYAVDEPIDDILAGAVEPPGNGDSAASAYFILKTGGGDYDDKPETEYHFKEGIPGSKQLRDAADDAAFVYLEDGEFYATGRVGTIREENRDGTTHYFATVENYEGIDPVSLDDIRNDIEPDFPVQYGIIKIPEADYAFILSGGEREPDNKVPLEGIDHSVLDHLDARVDSVAVYRFTAPPEYWLTSITTGTISFAEGDEHEWERLSENDVVLFYCQRSELAELEEFENGFVGAGVVRGRTRKPSDEPWWWDEYNEEASFPLLVAFKRLYVTGDADALVTRDRITMETAPDELTDSVAALVRDALPLERAEALCEGHTDQGLAISGTFSPFLADGDPELDRPRILLSAMAEDLVEIPPIDLTRSFDGQLSEAILDGLYFPGDQGSELVEQLNAALRSNKHVILTGPPGTGKTEIARRACVYLVEQYPYLYPDFQLTTATADWSTFDTVGGYMPEETVDGGDLSFRPGIVLNRLKSTKTGVQSNEPLVIDELNRADIDKSFGQLFTLLSGQSVQLPYTKDGQEIELCTVGDLDGLPASHQYVVPESWRIFATMNTYDKTSLYEMSYAFMRRFAFVRVSAPALPDDDQTLEDLMLEYVGAWDDLDPERDELTEVGRVWRATNRAVEDRAIGPAIVRDMLGYITQHQAGSLRQRLTEAVISYVFPQLEGVPRRKQIVRRIATVPRVDTEMIDRAARDMLQVAITEPNE